MRYFIDTEFIEKPGSIKLISIGIVSEDDREYYSISNEYDYFEADDWVKDNVIYPMYTELLSTVESADFSVDTFNKVTGKSEKQIAKELIDFISAPKYKEVEFWGYYSDYDWVVFCQLFGAMISLPQGFPMFCLDLKQEIHLKKIKKLPGPKNAHNALVDARWNKQMYDVIFKYEQQ